MPSNPQSATPASPANAALTGIRLPLALWVVAYHISGKDRMLESLSVAHPGVEALVRDAWAALTVFFAVSGFVLARRYTGTLETGAELRKYAVARFARIYPIYFLSLCVVLPFIWTAMHNPELGGPVARAGLLANYLLLLQAWHWPEVDWNTPAWSLSCELFFYTCTPAAVLLLRTASWRRVGLAMSLACALPIAARLVAASPAKPFLYVGDFLMGMAAACAYQRLRTSRAPLDSIGPWLYWPAASAFGALLLMSRGTTTSFLVFDTGLRLATGLLVLGLACGGGALVQLLSSPAVLTGGHASYAIYILHVPVLWWWRYYQYDRLLPPSVAAGGYVGAVVLISLAVHRWYEVPADRAIRRWLGASARAPTLATPRPKTRREVARLAPRGFRADLLMSA